MAQKIFILLLGVAILLFMRESKPLWGFALDGFPIREKVLSDLQSESGMTPNIILFYLSWPASGETYSSPLTSFESIKKMDAIACMTWEPFYFEKGEKVTILYQDILDGKYDPYIRFMAGEFKKFGEPVYLRFAHEMNLNSYHWGTAKEEYGPASPGIYQEIFRYVVAIFRQEGAANALWVYCPNNDSVPNDPWNTLAAYYPGDPYVDILGLDGYSWDENKRRSFEDIFKKPFQELKKINGKKPVFIFETAIPGSQHVKQEWIKEALKTAESWKIKGIIWFQVDKEQNWRIVKQS